MFLDELPKFEEAEASKLVTAALGHKFPLEKWGTGFCFKYNLQMSTFDDDKLTRLVVLAHLTGIRVEIAPHSKTNFRVSLFKRAGRLEHPGMERLVALARRLGPE
jgi:hypothetical protein